MSPVEVEAKRRALYELLEAKGAFELVKETLSESNTQLRLLGRVKKERFQFWLPVLHQLLGAASAQGFTCDISKQYLLGPGGVRYAWRVIFQSDDLNQAYDSILELIGSAPKPSRVEVGTVLLPGCRPGQQRGGVNARGKGATTMREALTGPLAAGRFSREAGG